MKTTQRKRKTPESNEKKKPDAEKGKGPSQDSSKREDTIPTDRPDRRWPERSDEEAIGRPIQLDHDPLDRDAAKRSGRHSR